MDYAGCIGYFTALAALTAAPGPIIAVLVARALGRDRRGAAAFAAGLCMGDVIAVVAVALGVGVWAESRPEWFALAKYAGVAYLLWLSIGMWSDGTGITATKARTGGLVASVGAGLVLCLGNPSTVLIYVLLLPTVAPTGIHDARHLALVVAVTVAAVASVFFGAILLARQANRLLSSPRSTGALNRLAAGTIALTAVWIVAV